MNWVIAIFGLLLTTILKQCLSFTESDLLKEIVNKNPTKLAPCKVCTLLVDSFKNGIEKTERGKHDGGDAEWEEQKLGSYKRSEIRLVEIQESLCKDQTVGEDQCHILAEASENLLEDWWFKKQDDHPDLRQWLCIDKLEVCCPLNTFGPNCDPCNNCHGNGKCKGNGTRKGNGKCACDSGYTGDQCMDCDINGYYESFRDDQKLLCSECHLACDVGGCTGAGPKACRVCKIGWIMEPELGGCIDVDECAQKKAVCRNNQFCVNGEGSFKCLECDKACAGCTGDGPDECIECIENYEMKDGWCKGNGNSAVESSLENNVTIESSDKTNEEQLANNNHSEL